MKYKLTGLTLIVGHLRAVSCSVCHAVSFIKALLINVKVFNAAVAWIKYNPTERSGSMKQLLQHVRLPLLRPQFLTDTVQMHPTVKTCLKCRDLVDKVNFIFFSASV